MINYSLRKSVIQDKPAIENLFIHMLQTIYQKNDVTGYKSDYLDKFYTGDKDWILVAESDDKIIAYVSIEYHHEKSLFLYLDDFCVRDIYRNLKIGTHMLCAVEKYAIEQDIKKIYLHVEKSNVQALKLYQRLEYVIDCEENTRYKMRKDVLFHG